MGEGRDIDGFTLNLMALAENGVPAHFGKGQVQQAAQQEKGRVPNFVFGYDRIDHYTLVPNPEESGWVRKIFDLYTEENGACQDCLIFASEQVKPKS